jgi:hypothetical protein
LAESRQPEVDALTAQLVDAAANAEAMTAQLKIARLGAALVPGLQQQIADLLAYKAAHPDVPSVWKPLYDDYLTTGLSGWTLNVGPRPTVDASTGRKENVVVNPDGSVTLYARRNGTTITSCDIISKHRPLPVHFAYEIDVQFGGYLGVGMFPCPAWFKTIEGGGGELDGLEYMGGRLGHPGLDGKMVWKMTAIGLPAASPLVQAQEQLLDFITAHNVDPFALNTWRWEKTDGRFEVFINGTAAAAITRAEFDAVKGSSAGMWDKNFENPALHWYTRSTWQVGPPSDTKVTSASAGPVPANWTESSMTISRMVAEEYVG